MRIFTFLLFFFLAPVVASENRGIILGDASDGELYKCYYGENRVLTEKDTERFLHDFYKEKSLFLLTGIKLDKLVSANSSGEVTIVEGICFYYRKSAPTKEQMRSRLALLQSGLFFFANMGLCE